MGLSRARQLQLLQHQIASAALSGARADEIERNVIARSPCAEEDKSALRLYAFSFLPRFDQRRIALDQLSAAGRDEARPHGSMASGQASERALERA